MARPHAAPDPRPAGRGAQGAELWLDGGHNPAGGEALAATLAGMAKKPTHLICGMLNTKDVAGYMRPLAAQAQSLTAIDIPGEPNTLPAAETARIAATVGLPARPRPTRQRRCADRGRITPCAGADLRLALPCGTYSAPTQLGHYGRSNLSV
jgi:hypothetical protein